MVRPVLQRPQSLGVYTPRKAATFSAEVIDIVRNYSGASWSSYGAIYRKQPAVRSVVDFLARNIAQLNPKVFERLGDNDRLEIGEHPLAELLRHPNTDSTRFRHLRDTVADIGIFDRAYWEKLRIGGRVRGVLRLPPSRMLVDDIEGRRRYRYMNGSVDREIQRSDLVVFPGYHPDGDELGVSPLETLRQVLLAELAATNHRAAFWNNAARQGGVIERPVEAAEWSDDARQRFRADLEAMFTGRQNSGRTMVLEEGMTWNSAAFSPKDAEYIAGRRLTYEEVSVAYFGPIVGRSFMEATGAGTESNHRQLYQDVLGPWLRMLQDEIELQLLDEFEMVAGSRVGQRVYVEFDLAAKLAGSFEEQSKSLVSAIGVPYMTINEGRARLNLSRVDGAVFDMPVQPLNVMYGGQPAVTVPTQVPGDVPGIASASVETKSGDLTAEDAQRERWAKEYEALFRRFFDRQAKSILSAKGAITVEDVERWDRELAQDLCLLAVRHLRKGSDLAFVVADANAAAEAVNAATYDRLLGSDVGQLRQTLDDAAKSRIDQLALERATVLVDYARLAAAV